MECHLNVTEISSQQKQKRKIWKEQNKLFEMIIVAQPGTKCALKDLKSKWNFILLNK